MKYLLDVHTHTIVSGHAYTTWLENVKQASEIGLKILGTTDHGPNMPGGPNIFYFGNFKALPRQLYGVTLLYGCEANIINSNGDIDLPKLVQKKMDIIIASLHDVCIKPSSIQDNTKALLNVMDNPLVDIIGHSGNPKFPINEEEVVKKAKEKNVLIEVNNGSFGSRIGSTENCLEILKLCKKYCVNIILGSDSHTCFQIGKFDKAEELLKEINMPRELIMNNDPNRLLLYLQKKGKVLDAKLD